MLYNRILLPVDGSQHSMHAVIQAIRLARQGGEIVVLTVMPEMPEIIGGDSRREAEAETRHAAELLTHPVMDIIAKENIPCRDAVVYANTPANGIIKTVGECKCDAIVMGSRGRNELEGLLLGSVTHRVLALASVPVLVVR